MVSQAGGEVGQVVVFLYAVLVPKMHMREPLTWKSCIVCGIEIDKNQRTELRSCPVAISWTIANRKR